MKTALSMVALMVLLASGYKSSSVAAEAQVTTSAKSATQVYVRTDPAGAEVRLAGESKGLSPQLIPVPDGATTMTVEVELDGYGRQQRQVKIEGGRITRVEFKFDGGTRPPAKPGVASEPQRHFVTLVVGKDRMTFQGKDTTWKELPGLIEKTSDRKHTVLNIARAPGDMTAQQWDEAKGRAIKLVERFGLQYLSEIGEHPLGYHAPETQAPPDQAGAPSFGPAVEQVLRDPEKGVAELLDLDTGRRATMKEFGRNDRETHAWVREEKVDVMGAVERGLPGVLLFECAVYENPDISWEKITPQEVVDHRGLNQNEPKPIIPLATQDPAKLPLICLFETREGTKGVLQLLGLSDDKQGVKIQYKLIRQAGRVAAAVGPSAQERITIRPLDADQIEIIIPHVDPEEAKRVEKLAGRAGTLEFRILANTRDHAALIKRALAEGTDVIKDARGNVEAWWVPVQTGREKDFEDYLRVAESRRESAIRETVRRGQRVLEVLVVKDPFDVDGRYLVGAARYYDQNGNPCVAFQFNAAGARLFARLTSLNLPDEVQDFYRKLGILLHGKLCSAPSIKRTVYDRGVIEIGTPRGEEERKNRQKEVDDLVRELKAGTPAVPPAADRDGTKDGMRNW